MSTLSADLRTLSREAYVYLYPIVTMEISRRQATNLPAGQRPGYGPPNQFHHLRAFPPADFRAVVRVNFDTLYTPTWLDLSAGPVKLHVPDSGERYYLLPMLDMWTDVFATIGKRTTGTSEGEYIIVGPGYTGELPAGLPVIHCPTPYGWIIGRIQTNGPADYPAVNALQDGFTITSLSGSPTVVTDPDLDVDTEPLVLANRLSGIELLTQGAAAMKVNPPHATDFAVLARIANLGIIPGQDFDPGRFTPEQIAQIEAGADAAKQEMRQAMSSLGTKANGWTSYLDSIGVYGNNYFQRAVVTMVGLGANPPEDAVYPVNYADAEGQPINGDNDYILHFDADQVPPVYAFWSVTMYDAEGFQIPNALDRFALGDRDPLVFNADGSLDLYLQQKQPDGKLVPNWLPTGSGPLGITLRLYAPKPEVLNGQWAPPVIRKAA